MSKKPGALRAYAVSVCGDGRETIINSRSRGSAKADFLRRLDMDLEYTALRCRVAGPVATSSDLRRTAEYRGVPFVRAGMRVVVKNERGVIVGGNSSSNFDVLFDDDSKYAGNTLNCHPCWEIAYFDSDGNVLADFRTAIDSKIRCDGCCEPREESELWSYHADHAELGTQEILLCAACRPPGNQLPAES